MASDNLLFYCSEGWIYVVRPGERLALDEEWMAERGEILDRRGMRYTLTYDDVRHDCQVATAAVARELPRELCGQVF